MAKEYSMYRGDNENIVYNTKDEKTYITENGTISFFFNKEGYIRGIYKVENGIETNYEFYAGKA